MSKFYRDFENDYNEKFTKGFLDGKEPFNYKFKFKTSDSILLKGKLGLIYNYRNENNNCCINMNE